MFTRVLDKTMIGLEKRSWWERRNIFDRSAERPDSVPSVRLMAPTRLLTPSSLLSALSAESRIERIEVRRSILNC